MTDTGNKPTREGAEAHTHGEPDTERLARGGAHPEAQPRKPQDTQSDGTRSEGAMAGDRGQTRQPQSSGMVQPDGGVNRGEANQRARE